MKKTFIAIFFLALVAGLVISEHRRHELQKQLVHECLYPMTFNDTQAPERLLMEARVAIWDADNKTVGRYHESLFLAFSNVENAMIQIDSHALDAR